MNSKIKTGFFLVALFAAHVSGSQAQAQNENRFEVSKQLEIFNALVKEMEMFYVDSIDVQEAFRRGIDAMLGGLDPYTEYIPEQEMSKLRLITTGEYGGIGAYIQKRNNGGVIITEPFENMPAALAGLRAGDCILAIDTINVEQASSDKVSELLKGLPNTKLKIKFRRPGEKNPHTVELTRRQVVFNQVVHYGVYNNVGYIYLRGFTDKSAQEVKAAFEDLRRNHAIRSLILDLRNNGGGVMESAVQIVNLFVPRGKEVVSTKGKVPQWDRIYRTASEPVDTVMPLAILINGASASAAEIVSGALQDMDRAVLIGQRSYGKGLVQSTRDLPYNGSLKVTISRYYIPSGRCIQQIDYTHRNADGSVGNIPDSLTSMFYTAHGRPVRDGGGIRPDFEVTEEKTPTLLYYLLNDYVLFDFITDYVQRHETIAPAEEFTLMDSEFEAFRKYAREKNFSYDRQSGKALKNLKDIAGFEGYLEETDSTMLQELGAKLTPDIERDFGRFKDPIKKVMAAEIVKRYYFERGELIQSLKDDDVLTKALEVLASPGVIEQTLRNVP